MTKFGLIHVCLTWKSWLVPPFLQDRSPRGCSESRPAYVGTYTHATVPLSWAAAARRERRLGQVLRRPPVELRLQHLRGILTFSSLHFLAFGFSLEIGLGEVLSDSRSSCLRSPRPVDLTDRFKEPLEPCLLLPLWGSSTLTLPGSRTERATATFLETTACEEAQTGHQGCSHLPRYYTWGGRNPGLRPPASRPCSLWPSLL